MTAYESHVIIRQDAIKSGKCAADAIVTRIGKIVKECDLPVFWILESVASPSLSSPMSNEEGSKPSLVDILELFCCYYFLIAHSVV